MAVKKPAQADMDDDLFELPTKEEWEKNRSVLMPDDYVCYIAKITLGKEPTWNEGLKQFDMSKPELQYKMILLPYCLKDGSEIVDTNGKVLEPMKNWQWRALNPFSTGFLKDGSPSLLRAFIAYIQGDVPNPNKPPKGVKGIVIDSDNEIASPEDAAEYRKNKRLRKEGELEPSEDEMLQAGFKDIPDLLQFEGQFIGAVIELTKNNKNKVKGFSRLPKNFKPDQDIIDAAMEKFPEAYEKVMAKRAGNVAPVKKATKTSTEEVIDTNEEEDTVEVDSSLF